MSWPDLGLVAGRLPRARLPRDWGFDMTLCIAAVAHRERQIVLAGDTMLSADQWSTETWVSKIEAISDTHRWVGMFAGDPTVWHEILGRLGDALKGKEESLEAVKGALRRAFREALRRKIEGTVLSSLGMSRERFLRRGREYLGEAE